MKQIEISRVDFPHAAEARGITIVIDVIRAFTVAAYAFAGGASRLWLVRTTDEAFALRGREPEALLAGEIGGRLIPGFDLNNSPALMAKAPVVGRMLIQRTGAGTQGAVNAAHSPHMLLCSLVNAAATAHYASALASQTGEPITLLPTGKPDEAFPMTEDDFCADYLEAIITGREDAPQLLADRIARLRAGRFTQWEQGEVDLRATSRVRPYYDDGDELRATSRVRPYYDHGDELRATSRVRPYYDHGDELRATSRVRPYYDHDNESDFPFGDIEKVLDANRFHFVMVGTRQEWQGITYVEVKRVNDTPQKRLSGMSF